MVSGCETHKSEGGRGGSALPGLSRVGSPWAGFWEGSEWVALSVEAAARAAGRLGKSPPRNADPDAWTWEGDDAFGRRQGDGKSFLRSLGINSAPP